VDDTEIRTHKKIWLCFSKKFPEFAGDRPSSKPMVFRQMLPGSSMRLQASLRERRDEVPSDCRQRPSQVEWLELSLQSLLLEVREKEVFYFRFSKQSIQHVVGLYGTTRNGVDQSIPCR
jgi:hypothetical protein